MTDTTDDMECGAAQIPDYMQERAALARKQTKLWRCKNGRKIRICDMTDSHLSNAIAFLERYTDASELYALNAAINFQGEQAAFQADSEMESILDNGIDPSDECPLYENLCKEKIRRNHDDNNK